MAPGKRRIQIMGAFFMLYASSLCIRALPSPARKIKRIYAKLRREIFCADHQTNSLSHALLRPPMGDLEIKPIRNREKTGFSQQNPPLKTLVPRTGPKKTCAVHCPIYFFKAVYENIRPRDNGEKGRKDFTVPLPAPYSFHFGGDTSLLLLLPVSSFFSLPFFNVLRVTRRGGGTRQIV